MIHVISATIFDIMATIIHIWSNSSTQWWHDETLNNAHRIVINSMVGIFYHTFINAYDKNSGVLIPWNHLKRIMLLYNSMR